MPVSLEMKELRPDVATTTSYPIIFFHYFKLKKLLVWETLSIFAQKRYRYEKEIR